jgi:site-specific DNA-methyltransferase (adenine-specific)
MFELNRVYNCDCITAMREIPENTIDDIVTDPPYGLKFMGKGWDHGIPGIPFWQEALRVCKPGAHMLAFGGTRTHHRLMVAIEDAGWEIRDTLMWVYGSGFPKSLDVSKAIDKAAGVEREVIGRIEPLGREGRKSPMRGFGGSEFDYGGGYLDDNLKTITAPATDAAKQWQGYGTALKPAWEPVILCRKPLEGTVAENVQKWGTGAINIDGCRIPVDPKVDDMLRTTTRGKRITETWENGSGFKNENNLLTGVPEKGRFPANLIHDGSDEVLALFPDTQPSKCKYVRKTGDEQFLGVMGDGRTNDPDGLNDCGSAARFFYCAKASKAERNWGLPKGMTNKHPTVKPLSLTGYLIRLISREDSLVLDPFLGSGTTGIACARGGRRFLGFEIEEESFITADLRVRKAQEQGKISEWF